MTPTSTKKGAKLYRYYVSMDVIRNRESGEETAPMRLAAGMVEDAVVTEVRRILQTPEAVLGDQCEPVSTKMAAQGNTRRTPGDFLTF